MSQSVGGGPRGGGQLAPHPLKKNLHSRPRPLPRCKIECDSEQNLLVSHLLCCNHPGSLRGATSHYLNAPVGPGLRSPRVAHGRKPAGAIYAPCLVSHSSQFPEFLASRTYISMVGNQLPVEVRAAAWCLPVNMDAFFFSSVYTEL